VLAVSVTAGLLAVWSRVPAYVFVSGLLLNVTGTLTWAAWGPAEAGWLVAINVLCLAVGSGVWSALGLLLPNAVPHGQLADRPIKYAHLAAWAAVATILVVTLLGIGRDLLGRPFPPVEVLGWLGLAAAAVAMAALLWDRSSRLALLGLYLLALAADGMYLRARAFSPTLLYIWAPLCELAAVALVAALIGWAAPRGRAVWRLLQITHEPGDRSPSWFVAAQAALGAFVAGMAAWIAIDFRFDGIGEGMAVLGITGRNGALPAALMLLGAAIVMAWQTAGAWRRGWQYASLAAGVLLTSSLGWSQLSSEAGTLTAAAPWLHRSVTLLLSCSTMTLLSGFGLGLVFSRRSDWAAAGRRAMPWFGAIALGSLAAVLVQEALLFGPEQGAPMAAWAVAIVAVALAALVALSIALAVMPAWDPLALTDRQRTGYVYLAEGLAALVGLHLWLTMPWLFSRGLVRQYWMLITVAGAFAGAGLSELFHRRRMPVLSEPLEKTALLLPLAPAVGFWLMPSPSAAVGLAGSTPLVWLLVAAFYAYMAVVRRSFGLAVLSLLSGNLGLWVLLHRFGLGFVEHPQLWLIPAALALLVAEQLDRRRLTDGQRTAIHYLALGTIYIASSAEYWRAMGQSFWLPLATIVLALLGVLLGILLRVQSFLYLGFTCLVVVILRLVYFASFERGQMWVLWTCCIALGAAIIALFAVFEKRRNDILAAVEQFKQWEK
jgi:hypothetical protein